MDDVPTFKGVAIRGIPFRPDSAQAAAASLKSGDPMLYEREPSNPYDPAAIRLLTVDGTFIGYVERLRSAEISKFIDKGQMFTVWVDGKVKRDQGVFKSVTFDPIKAAEQSAVLNAFLSVKKTTKIKEVA